MSMAETMMWLAAALNLLVAGHNLRVGACLRRDLRDSRRLLVLLGELGEAQIRSRP
ncbi:hypothetical protein [Pseudomonas schmalbachii]|uniref:Uncharacterized protein n=1 Tax=Pseudomonas schmalbachii TaxID=2816993 RepID=A0ABS3TKE7_9PSED|nr:hypothetical protein [Pseudomonas schmalbachii]MBO3274144.1 hypothetical protein [Pseudomonas schmalbachii]